MLAALAHGASLQPVTGIDLGSGLVGADFHYPTRFLVTQGGCQMQIAVLIAVDDPATVIALANIKSGEILLDVTAYNLGLGKVHGSALDGSHFTCRNDVFVSH